MSGSRHTPGPWRLGFPKAGLYTVRTEPDYLMVASNVSRGDAHLIASAPDLLEALESALPVLEGCSHTHTNGDKLYEKVKAALQKAKGGDHA